MAGLVPAGAPNGAGSSPPPGQNNVLEPLMSGEGNMGQRARAFAAQPLVRKALPWFIGLAGVGVAALLWSTLAPGPQRVLYSSLDDTSRAAVVATLDQAGIDYQINNNTGALSVSESDLYRARMMVAADGAIAAPETVLTVFNSMKATLTPERVLDHTRALFAGDVIRAAYVTPEG